MSKQDKKELRQQIACEWLEENYLNYGSLRHDVVGDRLQIKAYPHPLPEGRGVSAAQKSFPLGEDLGEAWCWRNLTDKDINTMVCQCVAESGVNISVTEMWTALKSDLVPAVHPLREWLNGLRPWSSSETDWIDMVAQKVRIAHGVESCRMVQSGVDSCRMVQSGVESFPAEKTTLHNATQPLHNATQLLPNSTQPLHNATQDLWRICFKKWFVAMVASWMKDEVVNHTVLVLVGRQGIYKTTWLDRLMPPELRAYSSKLPLSGQISKDDRLRLCENGLLNIDELDAICGREMNIVKSLLTSTDVNERAAYGRLKERRVRLASFCASTNNREFLTDITGNRRWLPFEVESIQNPFDDIILYERLYAQAKAYVECGYFAYWFDMDEIEVLEQHNEKFRALENEEELLPILFDKPAEGKGEFMTTAEISDRLVTYGGIKRPMSIRKLNTILERHEFKAVRPYVDGKQVRGWLVYKRKQDEIEIKQKELANKSQRHEDILF